MKKLPVGDQIVIAADFTDTPGARNINDGEYSGEEFYNRLLSPKFKAALVGKYALLIDLDNVWGFPSSFVSGSFGKLAMEHGKELVKSHIEFKSLKFPMRIEKILYEIDNPTSQLT